MIWQQPAFLVDILSCQRRGTAASTGSGTLHAGVFLEVLEHMGPLVPWARHSGQGSIMVGLGDVILDQYDLRLVLLSIFVDAHFSCQSGLEW